MNEPNQPPKLPPQISTAKTPPPLGDDPAERVAITGVVSAVESILRQPRRVMFQLREPGAGKVITALVLIAVVCSLIYGVIVGSFSGGDQWWAAPVKACAGLLVSAVIGIAVFSPVILIVAGIIWLLRRKRTKTS